MRMLLHAYHAAHHGHHRILIRTVDTDVVILSVHVVQTLGSDYELWLAFGTGKQFRYLPAHEIVNLIGHEKARALPMFHVITGCDTVSSFVGYGKKKAWTTWNALPELTNALLEMCQLRNDELPEDAMTIIQRFIILLYDRTSKCFDINKARRKLFTKRTSVKQIPPTKAALEQHIRRAVYQGSYVWGQLLLADPKLPSPTNWGWVKTDAGLYEP